MRTHYDLRLPLTLVAAGLAACGSKETTQNPGPTPPAQPGTIAQVAAADGRFGTLVQALTTAELVDTLSGPGPFTVFAPTDDAFAALPAGALDALLADREALTRVLTYHVVSGRVDAATVVTLSSATTLQGDDVAIEVRGGEVFVNQAKVIITDVPASNGLIHVIDAVLTPPEPAPGTIVDVAVADGRFTTLVAAVQAAGLAGTLSGPGPFTVFAPTDDAFAALPAGALDALLADREALTRVLTYHVVSGRVDAATVVTLDSATTVQGDDVAIEVRGGEVFVNQAKVIITDVPASNGLIHVIDAVLTPPEPAPGTIVDVAIADGRFTTLVAAVQAAGLADTLSGPGPFTVFAPTDDAFAALPAGALDALLADREALTRVLTYHVVSGRVDAATVVTLDSATTVQGDDVAIEVRGGEVFVNQAKVIITDVPASNGLIHVIDAVLTPPEPAPGTIVDVAIADGRFGTLVQALTAAELVDTLSGPGPFTVFAPTDDAFAALPAGALDALLADREALTRVLTYHVVSGRVDAATVVTLDSATTVQGDDVSIEVRGGEVFVNQAKVIITDVPASNGLIHVIDAVLTPPEPAPGTIVDVAIADGRFTTLVAAVQAAGLAGTISGPGPFTVFAPTDDAFAALPAGALDALLADREALTRVLTYHVVSGRVDAATVVTLDSATTVQGDDVSIEVRGGEVFVNQAKVIITDVPASNGLIHVIDAVLTPPEPAPGTIVDVAIADGRFTTLVAAVQAAGLADTLSGPGPFTVFAPTDDAFAALPAGTVEALLADPAALARVLTYHVVSGAVDAATVVGLDVATTVQGGPVFVRIEGGEVRINDARVIITDVPASNGIIHVIDAVLLPPAGSIADIVTSQAEFSTLATAVTTAGLAATLDGPGPFTVFAPTNDAFALIPAATLQGLLADTAALSNVLLYHVVPGIVPAAEVVTLSSATTAQGGALSIQVDAGVVRVGSAQVMVTDIPADNGIIHVIDAVLIP